MKTVEAEYIESGTFVGGEEDVSVAGIKRGETAIVLKKGDYEELLRYKKLVQGLQKLAGTFYGDEFQTVTISGDDATHTWHVKAGSTWGYGSTVASAIEDALTPV